MTALTLDETIEALTYLRDSAAIGDVPVRMESATNPRVTGVLTALYAPGERKEITVFLLTEEGDV